MAIKKITNFTFPISDKPLSQDAYFRVLSKAQNGFYPFSENGLWHGGIHIDSGVLCEINSHDTRLNCIGNGEVIAYRVNEVYPKIVYGREAANIPFIGDELVAYFSTGFTLVRHCFCMPKVAGESEKPPYITLYSLYMHQLDWYGYQQYNDKHPRNPLQIPTFWHLYEGRVSESTKESIKGSPIRLDGSKTTIVGLLLKGSKVKLGDEIVRYNEKGARTSRGWYKLESLQEGCIVTENAVHYQLGMISGYVYAGELNESIETDRAGHQAKVYSIKIAENDKVGIKENNVPGIVVYGEANAEHILGYLPKDVWFEFDGQDNGYAKIVKVHCNYIPSSLLVTDEAVSDGATETAPTHHGWVKLSELSSLKYRPKELDKVVVLDKPVAIKGGDLVGYLGHNVSRDNKFPQSEHFPLATMKRASDNKLSILGHIELFTCDDLPAFIEKTRALAEKLPESEKTLILVESGAQLISERSTDGQLSSGLSIKKIMESSQSYYIQVRVDYVLTLNRYQCVRENIVSSHSLNATDAIVSYRLTAENKQSLLSRYRFEHPELTEEKIPDEVELIGYPVSDEPDDMLSERRDLMSPYLSPNRNNHTNSDEVTIRFNRFSDSVYWVRADDIGDRFGTDILYQAIPYWEDFPLSLNHLPQVDIRNTVHYARTFCLTSIKQDNLTATDAHYNTWVYIRAGNKEGAQIQGWVNIAKGDKDYLQPHIKLASPWEWTGFNTIEEQATTGELASKVNANKAMVLDLADYTKGMSALHHILTHTPMNTVLSKKGRLPPFTATHLQEGLRTSWTAEQIGRLAIKYESEWYADSSLSKWDEIDVFYQKECEQNRQAIMDKLNVLNITRTSDREQAFKFIDQLYQPHCNEWQIEKAQRIKPSLWWDEVAKAQASQTTNTDTATTDNTPVLSNLSPDGKAWYLHPVGDPRQNIRQCSPL